MTSTNDGKDVKSIQTSGQKGKTYYIELYKSLDTRLSGECSGEDRTRLVCEAWRLVHSLCQHSTPSTQTHLLLWLQQHTSHTILQTEWQAPTSKEQHTWLEEAVNAFISECREAASKRDGTNLPWEAQLLNRARWFLNVLPNPWGHHVLKALLDSKGKQPSDKEVLEWLKEERGLMFVTRLRQLAATKRCVDLALLLATAIMNRVRSTAKIVADVVQAQETKDKQEVLTNESAFHNTLRKEAGFTQDVWDLLTDIEFVLHYKGESRARCIELAKQTPLRNAYHLVGRLHNRLENSPQDKKLWKNAKDVATLIAQVVIARCMVVPVCAGVAHDALYRCVYSLAQLLPADRLPAAAAALAAPAASSRHLHTLAAAVHAQYKEERKPFVCSLYVRAITAGMNELEKLKLETEKQPEARAIEQILASWFIQLGTLLSASSRLSYECILTAFSVHPSPTMYEMVKRAPLLAPLIMLDDQEKGLDTNSEYGSWATDSRTQTNLVKTSETLNLKQTRKQANVLSTAIFAEGEGLGLEADLCQDLAVLLSGPRVKTLYWDLDREVLLENCRTYMERTHDGTRALTTELKYLNLDPNSFQHLPEEEDEEESNIYYGIEKGYEHLVEFDEPEPEDIMCNDIVTEYSYTSDTASSIIELPMVILKQKKKKNKDLQLPLQEEVDPLSLTTDTFCDNKEILQSSEIRKQNSKERSKSKIRIENPNEHGGNNGITDQITKEIQQKAKKKERRERKKMAKQPVCDIKIKEQNFQPSSNLSRLVGMKIARPNSIEQERGNIDSNVINTVSITDSDYDSQRKSSINSECNDNVLMDAIYSIDDNNSSNKRLEDYKQKIDFPPFSYSPHAVTSVKEEVKKGIQRLIEYRRKKVFDKNSVNWDSPENQNPDCSVDREILMSKHLPSDMLPPVISPQCVNEASYIWEKEILNISHLKLKDSQEFSANEIPVKVDQPKIITPKYPSTLIKHADTNLPETPSQKQFQQFLLQRELASIQSQRPYESQSQSQFQEFLKKPVLQESELPGHLLYNTCKAEDMPKQQTSQQINASISPSQKQYHYFLKELQETINAGTSSEMHDSKYLITKKTSAVKNLIQPKKVDNAGNTYSRLSYMHKNKQCDIKPKSANKQVIHKPALANITAEEMQNIKDIDVEKVSNLQLSGQIVIAKIDKSKNKGIDENSKVLVQKIENVCGSTSSGHIPLNNPMLSNILSSDNAKSECTVAQNDIKLIKQCNKPLSKHSTSFLSEKDQFDLLLLLRQQNKMKPKMPNKTEICNSTSGILLNNSAANFTVSKEQSLDKPNQIPLSSEGQKSKTCPTSVTKSTHNKSLNNGLQPKKNRAKGSRQKVKTQMESDWKRVMDDLLAHKTPSRGPNALDIVLNKDSFEKRLTDNLNNQQHRTVSTSCKKTNKSANNRNTTKQSTQNIYVDTSTSREKLLNLKSTQFMSSAEMKQKQDIVKSVNNMNSVEIKNVPVSIQGKHFPNVIQNSNDPFISGIPNSDYDLLEELMDDDLRQEIGELSSDEETYRTPNLTTLKTRNSLHTKELNLPIDKANSLVIENPFNFSSLYSSDSEKKSCNTNYSVLNKDPASKTNSIQKGIKSKKPAFNTDANFKIISKEISTNSKSVKKIPLSGKLFKKVSGITPEACNVKKSGIKTSKMKIQSLNKMRTKISSNSKLSKTADKTKAHASASKVNKASKIPNILDPAQVLITLPKTNNAQNVTLLGTDLIYDPFSKINLNHSTKSGNSSELKSNTYVAGTRAPVNLALLHSTPFVGSVLNPVIAESSVSLPFVQKVSSNISKNLSPHNSEKPEISTICKENQHTNDIKTESIKPKALKERKCHKIDVEASKCQATSSSSTKADFDLLTSTPTVLHNMTSDLANSMEYDITPEVSGSMSETSTQFYSQTVKAPNLDAKFNHCNQRDKICAIHEGAGVNTFVDKALSLDNKSNITIDQERINKKRLFILNRLDNCNNRQENPIALPYSSITLSRNDIKGNEIKSKVVCDKINVKSKPNNSNQTELCQNRCGTEKFFNVANPTVAVHKANNIGKMQETSKENSVENTFLFMDNNVNMNLRSFNSDNSRENHTFTMYQSENQNQNNNNTMRQSSTEELLSKERIEAENQKAKLINEGIVIVNSEKHPKLEENYTDVIQQSCQKINSIRRKTINKLAIPSCQSLSYQNDKRPSIGFSKESDKCKSLQLVDNQNINLTAKIPQQEQLYTREKEQTLKKANNSIDKFVPEKNDSVEIKLVNIEEIIKPVKIGSVIRKSDDQCMSKIPVKSNNHTTHEVSALFSQSISQNFSCATKESYELYEDGPLRDKNIPDLISQSSKDFNNKLSVPQQPPVASDVTNIIGIKKPDLNTGTLSKEAVADSRTVKSVDSSQLETVGSRKVRNDDRNGKDTLLLRNESCRQQTSKFLDAKITVDELPADSAGPLKRCVRIKLPNGNTFKATISGKLNVNIDSIFEDPTVKSLLWKNINNNSKCTLNIKQVSIQSKKEEILKTEVKNISYQKPVIMTTDTINLISDDEEEIKTQTFKTEFGNFKIASMNPGIQMKHQKRLSQKSVVVVERCKLLKEFVLIDLANIGVSVTNKDAKPKERPISIPQEMVTDYIEIDDSSNDSISVISPEKNTNEISKTITENKLKHFSNDIQTETHKLTNDIDQEIRKGAFPVQQIEYKSKQCLLKLKKCDDLVEQLRVRKRQCFVSLVRCDVSQNFENKDDNKVIEEYPDVFHCLEDEIDETPLKRSDSFSILNEMENSTTNLPIFNQVTHKSIFPSLINNLEVPVNQTENLISSIDILLKLSNKKCDADWCITKSFLSKYENILNNLPQNCLKKCENDEESLTDCDSDLEGSLLTDGGYQVPRLVTLTVNFLVNDSDAMDRLLNTDFSLRNITNSSTLIDCDSDCNASLSTNESFQVPRLLTLIVNLLANDSGIINKFMNKDFKSKCGTNSSQLNDGDSNVDASLSSDESFQVPRLVTLVTNFFVNNSNVMDRLTEKDLKSSNAMNASPSKRKYSEIGEKERQNKISKMENQLSSYQPCLTQPNTSNIDMYDAVVHTSEKILSLCSKHEESNRILVFDNEMKEADFKEVSQNDLNTELQLDNTFGTNSTIPMEMQLIDVCNRNMNKDFSAGVQSLERTSRVIDIAENAECCKEVVKNNTHTCSTPQYHASLPIDTLVDKNVRHTSTTCVLHDRSILKPCLPGIESDSLLQTKNQSNIDKHIKKSSSDMTNKSENYICAITDVNSNQSNESDHHHLLTENSLNNDSLEIKTDLKSKNGLHKNESDKSNALTESFITNHSHLDSPYLNEVTSDSKENDSLNQIKHSPLVHNKTTQLGLKLQKDKNPTEHLKDRISIDSDDKESSSMNLNNIEVATTKTLTLKKPVSSDSNISFPTDVSDDKLRVDLNVKESTRDGAHDMHLHLKYGRDLTVDSKNPETESELNNTIQLKHVPKSHEDSLNMTLEEFKTCSQVPDMQSVLIKQLDIEQQISSTYVDALKLSDKNINIEADITDTKTCIKNETDSMKENGYSNNSKDILTRDLKTMEKHTSSINKIAKLKEDIIVNRDSSAVIVSLINEKHSEVNPESCVVYDSIAKEETVNYLTDKCYSTTAFNLIHSEQQAPNSEVSLQMNDKPSEYSGEVCSLHETKDKIADFIKHTNNFYIGDNGNSVQVQHKNKSLSRGPNSLKTKCEAIIDSSTNQNIERTGDVTYFNLKEGIIENKISVKLVDRRSEKNEYVKNINETNDQYKNVTSSDDLQIINKSTKFQVKENEDINAKQHRVVLKKDDFFCQSYYHTTSKTTNINAKYQDNDAEIETHTKNLVSGKEKSIDFVLGSIGRTFQTNQDKNEHIACSNVKHTTPTSKNLMNEFGNSETDEKVDSSTLSDGTQFQKNVTLVYKRDSNVILKGSLYEDSVVGTCYVFPVINRIQLNHELNCSNTSDDKTNFIETLKLDKGNEECFNTTENFNVVIPKLTYSRRILINNDNIDNIDDKRNRKNLKRKMSCYDSKLHAKRYRNGKNIDYPKFSVAAMLDSAYSKEYKRLMDYCNSIKFSYSRPFHKECINVPDMLKSWPIKELDAPKVYDGDIENILFSEEQSDKNASFDPLQYSLAEEISHCTENRYVSCDINETNFNMGFGERSDRVKKILEDGNNISKVSAATLSDVKPYQPFLTSEDYFEDKNRMLRMSNKNQIDVLKRSIAYIKLRDKVRSYFKKTTEELNYNYLMDNIKSKNEHSFNNCTYLKSGFPYDLLDSSFIQPAPVESIVQVVQIGQLPISAAAQNPMTCDPRVTQVTDVSPQCSIENSPHDDSNPPIKTEYTELTTADLSMPVDHEYDRHNRDSIEENSEMPNRHHEDIPVETELTSVVKTEITVELSQLKEEPIDYNESDDLQTLVNKHIHNVDYSFDSNDNSIHEPQSNRDISYESLENRDVDSSTQEKQNSLSEKTDQIAHAMNAAGITTTSDEMVNTEINSLNDIWSQRNCEDESSAINASSNDYSKTSINTMTLQQALAQILPPPLNQTNVSDNNQTNTNSSVTSQVLHIVQEKNPNVNQLTLVDNTQNSVISNSNTPVLHIVQNKGATANSTPNANSGQHTNSYNGLSLVDAGQGSNQLLHIVNTGNQKNNTTGQVIKRVNLVTNIQGSNEQKMVQFVCKSADGKSIHLNAPHQRSMVLRLQPIESHNIQSNSKATESQDTSTSSVSNTNNATSNKELTNAQNEIKSRSVYEENYAKFIQNSNKPAEKCTILPKFGQAFGKQVFQDGNQKGNDINANNSNSESSECQPNDNSMNLDHIGPIPSPPLLLRKPPSQPAQTPSSQGNIAQQLKQTIGPMNIQTMHGGVIYTRQIPVNIGGGQTINLITVPSTELAEEANQKQKSDVKFVNQNELNSPVIKIVPQNQNTPNAEGRQDDSNKNSGLPSENVQSTPTQHQPVLTQMRIKLPMLSKAPQMVSGARVVRPSFFQIQRNVIGGANQHVYQQLVLTAAPPLGQHSIRLPQAQASRQHTKTTTDGQSTSEPQMSSSTLEQLREFDMVLEQVKERSTVQPNSSTNGTFTKMQTPTTDTMNGTSVTSTVTESTQQVLHSIGSNTSVNVAYINRKTVATAPTTSTFNRSPDSSGIIDTPSSSQAQIPRTVTSESTLNDATAHPTQAKPAKSGSKAKSRTKSSNPPHAMKIGIPPKPTLKPQEDEQTTQRILYILAEYKEQVENSPDKDKPAPRRRTNPPTNPGSSKRKKSSSRRSGGRDSSPVNGDDACRTMGSEDSSCGTSQGDCSEGCRDSHSPHEESPRKVVRKLTFENQTTSANQAKPHPQRNVIVADGQTITVARGTAGKPTTAVLMPANYILPVSMVKGGQQIAIMTNRGPKLLTVAGEATTNALLLQRLIGPAGLKPLLTRPGVRQIRLPTAALHNLQTINLTTAKTVQPSNSSASSASAPAPPGLVETRVRSSQYTDRESDVKHKRDSSSEGTEPWNLHSSADQQDYTYEERVRSDNMNRTVLEAIPDRYSPDMEAQRIFDKMFDVDSKKSYIDSHDDSSRCAYDIDASDSDDKVYHQVVHRKDGSTQRHHRLTHVSAAALRHKYAVLEHELRLQKSLSEECEDLGVDSPSASELFPEAELLFTGSPAHEATHHSHTRKISINTQPTILNQSGIPQPDIIDDQIATDELIQRDGHDDQQEELDVSSLGLDEGIVTVNEKGEAIISLDQEEFARSHPNTTFHREPTDEGVIQPFTIVGPKGRQITSTIFHAGRAPATVLVTAPQTTVISQANPDPAMQNHAKYMNQIINQQSSGVTNGNLNLSSVVVKDNRPTKFDNILTDSRELHLSNTASAIIHSTGNATQVIRRVGYEDNNKRATRFIMDDPEAIIAGDDAKMVPEDSSRDATFESIPGDDDNSLPERHTELFWESNSASERSESRRPMDFSSDSEKCCKSPSYDEANSTDSGGVGTHMRLDSVIKDARGLERSCSGDGSSADDTHPPLRTYPAKRMYHVLDGDMERSVSGKTRAGENSLEVRRRASGRGVVKRGCHCCTGSPAPPKSKKPRHKKPSMDFTN